MNRTVIVALLFLSACSGGSTSSSNSSSGSSGSSTLGGAGATGSPTTTGGSGATSSGTSTGSAATGTTSSGSTTGGEPSCDYGQRWDGTACAPSKWAAVGVNQQLFISIDGGVESASGPSASLTFGEYLDGGQLGISTPTPVGCTVLVHHPDAGAQPYSPASQVFAGDWGAVSLSGTLQGTLTFDIDAGPGYVKAAVAQGQPLLAGGETLTVTASGGADFPAASIQVVAPPALTVSHAGLVRGQPYSLTWSGTSAGNLFIFVEAFGNNDYFSASCVEPDNGSFTLDSSLTSQIPPDTTVGYVIGIRDSFQTVYPAQPFVVEELYASWLYEAEIGVQ